jgi:glycosyltransferase involved in cell wall biosynthesis
MTNPSGGVQRVGAVANLRRVKGVDLLVEAAALVREQHPHVVFEIAGDGPERGAVEELIACKQLTGQFRLLGNVKDIPRFLSTLDVAVLCSRAEGMPNALLEYMAAGRPIVATSVGGSVQLVKNEVHGLLVPPESPRALARAIARLLGTPGLAKQLAGAARKRARQKYSRESMVRTFERYYRWLVMEGRSYAS